MKTRIFISIILLFTACGKDNSSNSDSSNNPDETDLILNQKISINGKDRAYHLYLPDNPKQKPVVVLLHGNSSNYDQVLGLTAAKSPQKVWLDLAKQDKFILLVPNGSLGPTGRRGWNDCRKDDSSHPSSDDVAFIDQLLQKLHTDYNDNTNKTFVAGVSNGGIMAQRLAQEIPNKLTAFAAVIAEKPANSECANATVPISALFMNGTADPIIPFEGGAVPGNGGTVKSTQETLDYWISRDGVSENPEETAIPDSNQNDGSTAKEFLYKNGTNNTEVALYKITGGGHAEPSIDQRYSSIYLSAVGNQNGDIEMTTEIWNFFKDKSK